MRTRSSWIWCWVIGAVLASGAGAQQYTTIIDNLPTCTGNRNGRVISVSDAVSDSDCTVGGATGTDRFVHQCICDTLNALGPYWKAVGGVDLSPYVLLAGDADGQTIQGVAGSNKPHLSLGDTYVSLRASTDGTDETLSFLNVGATGVEIDVHDGVAQFQMNDNGTVFTGAVLRMNGMTVPTTASDPCFAGAVAWDSGFWYVCIALDTWKRTALSTW